jgi:lipid-A-disaccharide synthase
MSGFVDHILAILPFEPEAHRRLGGPPCTYVGHPLIERLEQLRPREGERAAIGAASRPTLLVLPGSRHGEIKRHMHVFGAAIAKLIERIGEVELILPAVARLAPEIRARAAEWPVQPTVVVGETEKLAAFRRAHVALAASGTVTLELALSGVPMAVAYRVDPMVKPFKYARKRINSFVLPNLITGTNDIPEFLDAEASPERLAAALVGLFAEGPARNRQLAAFERLLDLMTGGVDLPSRRAADIVIAVAQGHQRAGGDIQRRLETGT